jgi:hypothetical protein
MDWDVGHWHKFSENLGKNNQQRQNKEWYNKMTTVRSFDELL